MLDNMNIKSIKKAILWRKKLNPCVKIEISGGVSLSNIKKLSSLDIDYISIGMLTHSPKSIDITLKQGHRAF
ncbi:nicotinate-nucleotide diphosphorylase (carboxylating), partial [bacterium]|nr:nicotinate-nucleotide diphosphorylase (carboxylating) [bacterium]